jgi:hypothetical protein
MRPLPWLDMLLVIVSLGAPLACSSNGPVISDGDAPDGAGTTCGARDPLAHADAGPPQFDSGQPVDALSPSCGTHDPLGRRLYGVTDGVPVSYDGPAVIERSSPSELVIAHQPAGAGLPLHTKVYDLGSPPMFPVGAKVWLSTDYHQSIVVRDQEKGRLLFGSINNPGAAAPAPFPIQVRDTCTTIAPLCTGTIVYGTIDVMGETVVSIYDSETRIVTIDGIDYDVRVTAQNEWLTSTCPDYLPAHGSSIEFRAHDLACLARSLAPGTLPACGVGNDEVNVSLSSQDFTIDGPVFYRGRSDVTATCYEFDDVAGVQASLPAFELCADPGIFPEPFPGQEFWVTRSGTDAIALREPQRGPVVIGRVAAIPPFDAATMMAASEALGIAVGAEWRCDYGIAESGGIASWDIVFNTSPPTRVPSETITPVQIGGRDYKAWASAPSTDYIWVVVYR